MVTRRQFVGASAVGVAARLNLKAAPLGLPIGCQVYPVRKELAKDFAGTLRQLAALGYKNIEMCSPPGYASDFGPLMNMSASEMKRIIHDAGLRCESSHYNRRELKENLEERIAFAKELGAAMKRPTFLPLPAPLLRMILSDFADEVLSGQRMVPAELERRGYSFEHPKIDGALRAIFAS